MKPKAENNRFKPSFIKKLILKSSNKIPKELNFERDTALDIVCKILFWAYMGKIHGSNKFTEIATHLIEDLIENLDKIDLVNKMSILEGIPSILFMFQILEADDLINISLDDTSAKVLLNRLQNLILTETKDGNVDYLYGLTSGYYCLSYYMDDHSIFSFVKENIESFINLACENENELYFQNKVSPNSDQIFLGTAHGQASIISLLCRLYKFGITHTRVKTAIEKNINFITQLDRNKNDKKCRFPMRINERIINEYSKELRIEANLQEYMIYNGWCHGDLNIALCISAYAQCFQNLSKLAFAKDIMMNVIQNNIFNEAQRMNSYVCHGSSSVSLLLTHFNTVFNDGSISNARRFWLNKTVELYSHELDSNDSEESFTFLGSLLGTSFILFSEILKNTSWQRLMLIH
ncbi:MULTISPECIES: lanthionine synthetase LanC family protein [Sphingobacterium]|uniref:lanthionine synthetase LanC family protein n=1 Tax=Sphingobacterium TaxID=28453 RepID=UPI00257BC4ED|nr:MULTISPECIES: lanthionine synthetase LanC family protein [Sphingobacterium]